MSTICSLAISAVFMRALSHKDSAAALTAQWYLSVFLVTAVDLRDAVFGGFSGGRGGEGLLHPAGTFPQTALDAEGLVQFVHLRTQSPSIFN